MAQAQLPQHRRRPYFPQFQSPTEFELFQPLYETIIPANRAPKRLKKETKLSRNRCGHCPVVSSRQTAAVNSSIGKERAFSTKIAARHRQPPGSAVKRPQRTTVIRKPLRKNSGKKPLRFRLTSRRLRKLGNKAARSNLRITGTAQSDWAEKSPNCLITAGSKHLAHKAPSTEPNKRAPVRFPHSSLRKGRDWNCCRICVIFHL